MIESFESSTDGIYGDLLSQKIPEKELKVGLYTGGYFEYWRMYPETLKKTVEEDLEKVYRNLQKHISKVVWPGLISTIDDAERAGQIFAEEKVDLIVYTAATYHPDIISLQALGHMKNVPLIVYVTQSKPNVDLKTNYEETLRDSGLISTCQLTASFKKMGWFDNFEVVVGAGDDPEVYLKIKRYANAVKVYNQLQTLEIGVIGHVFRGMYDFEYDRTKIKGFLGPNVMQIQISHFLAEWEKVDEKEAKILATETQKRFKVADMVTPDDILHAAKFTIALRRTIEKFELDALCFLGQHYTERKTGSTAFLAGTLLHEEGKYMITSEGDVHGLVMMCIMNRLTSTTPGFAEWGEFDEKNNAILMMFHEFGDPNLASDEEEIRITRAPEEWGFEGSGVAFEFTCKPGIVTVGHFIDDKDGYQMLITRGKALDIPMIPCEDITMLLQLERPVKEFISDYLKSGFPHHAILAYGDITKELEYIADFMNIRKVFL